MRRFLFLIAALVAMLAGPGLATAQIVPSTRYVHNLPLTCDNGTPATRCTLATPVVNPDGTFVGAAPSGASANQAQGTGASGATAVGNPVGVGGVFNTTPAALSNGQRGNMQITSRGAQLVSGAACVDANCGLVSVSNSAVGSSQTIKASAGNLYDWQVTSGASAGYVLIFNATTAPADGAVNPNQCVTVAANTTVGSSFNLVPEYYNTGITIVFSTTGCFTKTASATAFIRGRAQ